MITLASNTCGLLVLGHCQYQEQGPCSGRGVSWLQVQSSGTVYNLPEICKSLSPSTFTQHLKANLFG